MILLLGLTTLCRVKLVKMISDMCEGVVRLKEGRVMLNFGICGGLSDEEFLLRVIFFKLMFT
jgi:hypothetical protein